MKTAFASVLFAASLLVGVSSPASAETGTTVKKAPAPAAQPKSKLAKAYSLSTGEFVALMVPTLISNFHLVNVPVLAAYDEDEDEIGIMLFGGEGTVDAARQAIEAFREKLEPIRGLIELTQGLKLDEEDFYLEYYDVNKDKLVLEWKDGEYKMH